ncbi:hypothetical protein M431DRAFT_554413 [Trichoderma harzianum CBS 226.95]|uniref:Uncharacterized protein n=1 Tax=Trichoderma harzianum CBS 226.95 TaxID=983964 RepID=A0A2T4ADU6_TRIHA|nr:hypothetical protein M431DRAFT_554413 [Trichoderma harzianum CBS 226.95]PTB55216.1 hypothetical protein M431DRAFT_554413 [Trichoderma harzianum CBS 226.95]
MSLGRLHPPYCIHVVLDIMCFALPPPRRAYPVLSNPVQYEHAQEQLTGAAAAAAGPMQIIYRQIEAFWRAAARINPDLLHAVLRGNSAEFLGGASTETRIFLLYAAQAGLLVGAYSKKGIASMSLNHTGHYDCTVLAWFAFASAKRPQIAARKNWRSVMALSWAPGRCIQLQLFVASTSK